MTMMIHVIVIWLIVIEFFGVDQGYDGMMDITQAAYVYRSAAEAPASFTTPDDIDDYLCVNFESSRAPKHPIKHLAERSVEFARYDLNIAYHLDIG